MIPSLFTPARLRAAVEKYGDHIYPCPLMGSGHHGRCTCGFSEALKGGEK